MAGAIVTRFAPSPTGYLHVGGARTALYSWAYARHHGGRFILRIEDTDQERSDPAMALAIVDSLRWLGIDWDEGPYFQSERRSIYNELFEKLLAAGLAYECYCSADDVEARVKASGIHEDAFRYDGHCRTLSTAEKAQKRSAGVKPALRLRMPDDATTIVRDEVRGAVTFDGTVLDDLVIRKSDGLPTFHFAVAVDDALMGVTDVIRGDDHLSNTPKQIRILAALHAATGDERFSAPRYAHLALILGPDGKRFSKRHGATAVGEYRSRGFLPEALANYLALLGWSPGDDREIMTREEFVSLFGLDRLGKRGAVFDEQKLLWMNGQYMTSADTPRIRDLLAGQLAPFGITDEKLKSWGVELGVPEWLSGITRLAKERSRLIPDCIEQMRFFLEDEIVIDPEAAKKHFRGEMFRERMMLMQDTIEKVAPWSVEALDVAIRSAADAAGFKHPKVMHPTRVAVTGRGMSPGLFETIFFIGRRRAVSRLNNVIANT